MKDLSKIISDLETAMKVINSQDMNNMKWNSVQGWVSSGLNALKNMESSSRIMSAKRTYSESDMRKCWQACVESFNDCYAPNLDQFLSEYAT